VTEIVASDDAGLALAASAVERGEIVALPTDTLYALAASCRVPEAAARIFVMKKRGRGVPLPVLCADLAQAHGVGVLEGRALDLAREHWPGPLTLVVPRRPGFDADLGDDHATVGIRVSNDGVSRVVAAAAGPLATSSANLHGEAEPPSPEEIAGLFGGGLAVVVRRPPDCPGSTMASTIVRCDSQGRVVESLRRGAIQVDTDSAASP